VQLSPALRCGCTPAGEHRGNWWVQYCQATWRVRHGDHRGSAEALTRAILAGSPCGMYYTRARCVQAWGPSRAFLNLKLK
jgi:hypothetical protein